MMSRPFGNGAMSRNSARDDDASCGYAPSRSARRVRRRALVREAVDVTVDVNYIDNGSAIDMRSGSKVQAAAPRSLAIRTSTST